MIWYYSTATINCGESWQFSLAILIFDGFTDSGNIKITTAVINWDWIHLEDIIYMIHDSEVLILQNDQILDQFGWRGVFRSVSIFFSISWSQGHILVKLNNSYQKM